VRNLLLIPSFALSASAIVKRNPLSITARRAGWVGCTIALNRIPSDARISVVSERTVSPAEEVRAQFNRMKPLAQVAAPKRGWTLDVLNAIRSLDTVEFTTEAAYSLAPRLQALHSNNRHVHEKIRQQLQVLRDSGLLIHVARGRWRLS
jgi:type II restriction enzyme